MKRAYFACLFQCLATTFLLPQSNPVPLINQSAGVVSPISASQADPKAQARILDSYGKLPLSFEANHGQADARVKFLSRIGGYSLFLTGDEAVLTLSGKKASTNRAKIASGVPTSQSGMAKPKAGGVLRMKIRNANPAARVTGIDELSGTSNYFIGNDPTKWRTDVPTYAKVKYEEIYSGIDLVYYGNQRQLEYDFIVAPGADPRRIAFDVSGATQIRQDGHGDLVFKVGDDEIRWHKPVVYQEKDGARQLVATRYAVTDRNRVGFELAKYDASRPLYIDPLIYSTYLGGSFGDGGSGIAVDSAGNAYVTGYTSSFNFPTMNPLQQAYGGGNADAFVTKINAAGSALVYSTHLGGNGSDAGNGIAVDSAGNAYVIGVTTSTNFPTMNPLQAANAGGQYGYDAFVARINPAGSALVYSTYLGGSGDDSGSSIAVDSAGNAYVTGDTESADFPTMNPLQPAKSGGYDAFVARLNPAGSALVYSTYLGGSGGDSGSGIAVDSAGNAYVTGYTESADFPVTSGAFQTVCGDVGCAYADAFVTKINTTGSALVYSTHLGGNGSDLGNGIAVDSAGNAYVTGRTFSTDFPTTPGAFQTIGSGDAFVTKINTTGSALVYSTYLGGSMSDSGNGIAVDSAGNAYVTGSTDSNDFPTTPGAFQKVCNLGKNCGNYYWDAFITRLNSSGSALVYSTYLGGSMSDSGNDIAVDSAGNAYVTGGTQSSNFPTTSGAFQKVCNGGSNCAKNADAFVTKINPSAATTTTLSSSLNPSTYGQVLTFTAVVASGLGAPPDGESVSFKKGAKVLGTGTLSGGSASFTTSTLPVGTDYIKAVYGGDSNFAGSTSNTVSQGVNKATTTTTLASSQNPSNFGQSVTFTATVTPQFTGKVTGTVTFYDGTTVLKTVALSGGVAKFTTSTLTSGAHTITATYNGSTSFTGSSASLTQTVN
jgi:Bacterial Ig-like domain (group 3)/Beta-propeller repeat